MIHLDSIKGLNFHQAAVVSGSYTDRGSTVANYLLVVTDVAEGERVSVESAGIEVEGSAMMVIRPDEDGEYVAVPASAVDSFRRWDFSDGWSFRLGDVKWKAVLGWEYSNLMSYLRLKDEQRSGSRYRAQDILDRMLRRGQEVPD